jgi:aminoglycoside phosphotransferase (APT) family kinase protein
MAAKPAAEIEVTLDLVRGLLTEQRPDLAPRHLEPVASGWDNEIVRLGDDLVVRLPRRAASAALLANEARWLPALAPRLPLPVPTPLHVGAPSEKLGYPWAWTIVPWLPGVPAERVAFADPVDAAWQLGRFQAAIHRPAPADAPANPYRGVPLEQRADRLHAGLDELGSAVDRDAVLGLWSDLVATSPWSRPPVWLHGDVHPLNVLVVDGRISAVIDFGDVTSGDPASDLAGAWTMFDAPARCVFREAAGEHVEIDDDTWRRARGWALALGVAMANGGSDVAAFGRRALDAALHDGD